MDQLIKDMNEKMKNLFNKKKITHSYHEYKFSFYLINFN